MAMDNLLTRGGGAEDLIMTATRVREEPEAQAGKVRICRLRVPVCVSEESRRRL